MSPNVMQRLWCAQLLARTPAELPLVRERITATKTWLERYPTRTLKPSYRELLMRFEHILDALPARPAPPVSHGLSSQQLTLL